MDRNAPFMRWVYARLVALRKESVDRNIWPVAYDATNHASLSARRAWIEIGAATYTLTCRLVALRKESVDRNLSILLPNAVLTVALRKESVDRNQTLSGCCAVQARRSPQGERG